MSVVIVLTSGVLPVFLTSNCFLPLIVQLLSMLKLIKSF